jgi:hypothetical protein
MSNTPDSGACTHFQPADLIALAEAHLHACGVAESEWEGKRFRWAGPIDSPPFTGLVMECKRKGDNWVLTKLDRRKDGVDGEVLGLMEI